MREELTGRWTLEAVLTARRLLRRIACSTSTTAVGQAESRPARSDAPRSAPACPIVRPCGESLVSPPRRRIRRLAGALEPRCARRFAPGRCCACGSLCDRRVMPTIGLSVVTGLGRRTRPGVSVARGLRRGCARAATSASPRGRRRSSSASGHDRHPARGAARLF